MDILPVNAHRREKGKEKGRPIMSKERAKEKERIKAKVIRTLSAGHAKRQGTVQ